MGLLKIEELRPRACMRACQILRLQGANMRPLRQTQRCGEGFLQSVAEISTTAHIDHMHEAVHVRPLKLGPLRNQAANLRARYKHSFHLLVVSREFGNTIPL